MEFHAVILCGPGKNLSPFSQQRATGLPKALLPLAQKPMYEYVLDWCEKAFFPRVTLLCEPESCESLREAVGKYKASKTAAVANDGVDGVDLTSDVLKFIHSIEVVEYSGTSSGQVVQFLAKNQLLKPLEHFVLLPCDFITNLPPHVLIEAYRCRRDSDLGVLVYYRNQLDIEDKKNKIFPKNYTVYTDLPCGSSQLLDYYSADDVEFHKGFKIRTQLLWKHPKTCVSTKLLNSSIFFGNSQLISDHLARQCRQILRLSATGDSSIGLLVVPEQADFFRANTLPVYMEANRHFLKIQARESAGSKPTGPKDKTAANVGVDSMVGEDTQLGDKTNVKRSVVGANCVIGKRVKLTGSIVLDNAVIEDDVQLENTIVGHDATIRSKSKLINCYVESTHDVLKGTQSKGDTLLCLTLEGLVESAIESSSDEDDDSESSYDEYEDEYVDNADGLFAY
ncbi:hypothetical protein JCM33374_g2039 [Metschnikowia sp. JCM 33374]|nr:hypothetical protein JCM33374_g2039 [Metschnikowia sp. JCM 33374]